MSCRWLELLRSLTRNLVEYFHWQACVAFLRADMGWLRWIIVIVLSYYAYTLLQQPLGQYAKTSMEIRDIPRMLSSMRRHLLAQLRTHMTSAQFSIPHTQIVQWWFGLENMAWFTRTDSMDKQCRDDYGHHVEAAIAQPTDILHSYARNSTTHALGLILLLDQLSRNIYRGPASAQVFTECDPLAQSITHLSINEGIDMQEMDPIKRMFFYMPLMHSESLSNHDLFLSKVQPEGDQFLKQAIDFAHQHKDIVARFGRYPHRNEVLGRQPTAEEIKFLADGGATFS